MNKINVGCGKEIKEGWINLDIVKGEGVDIVHNLNKFPYPFKDNEFDEIYAYHILEHLDDFLKSVKELYRILKPKGKLFVRVPHFSSAGAFTPHHKLFFNTTAFDDITIGEDYSTSLDGTRKLFKLISKKLILYKGLWFLNYLFEPLINLILPHYERSFLKAIFPSPEIRFIFQKNE